MTVTKQQQIDQRRQAVLELSSQGLTQQEIAGKLLVSQKTVSNDLTWLKKDAIEFVKRNREHIAFEYKQALSNFYQLRKEGWNHFHSTANESIKISLYSILQNINHNIQELLSVSDIIAKEVIIAESQLAVKESREALQEINKKEEIEQQN